MTRTVPIKWDPWTSGDIESMLSEPLEYNFVTELRDQVSESPEPSSSDNSVRSQAEYGRVFFIQVRSSIGGPECSVFGASSRVRVRTRFSDIGLVWTRARSGEETDWAEMRYRQIVL